jgi:hypothetical protein
MTTPEPPAFDDVGKALVFAMNAAEAYHIASPVMNKAMAAVPVAKPKAKKKKQVLLLGDPALAEPEEIKHRPTIISQPGEHLRGLNKAMQAGFILQIVGRLDPQHARILEARYIEPTAPCYCQSPCCQGFRQTLRWSKAIVALCEILKESADVLRQPGKKGLSTEPVLRRLLVERYFLNQASPIARLARIAKVSPITAAKHDGWIRDYLERERTEAMMQIAALFDQEGVTGFLD